jgi:hypothetical protein
MDPSFFSPHQKKDSGRNDDHRQQAATQPEREIDQQDHNKATGEHHNQR